MSEFWYARAALAHEVGAPTSEAGTLSSTRIPPAPLPPALMNFFARMFNPYSFEYLTLMILNRSRIVPKKLGDFDPFARE